MSLLAIELCPNHQNKKTKNTKKNNNIDIIFQLFYVSLIFPIEKMYRNLHITIHMYMALLALLILTLILNCLYIIR